MTVLIVVFLIGCFLSAFFSGSETGFYRVSRVRLILDGLDGDRISRCLLWLTNNPALFIATTLIGNNLANYVTSLAIVLAAQRIFSGDAYLAELLGPIVFAPIIFVYGELLPKNMFLQAPNRMLRIAGPPFFAFGALVLPLAVLLWVFNRCLQWLFGKAPEQLRMALARNELQRVLQEGHEVGILQPMQKAIAHNLFTIAHQTAGQLCIPEARVVRIRMGDRKADVLRIAKRQGSPYVAVSEENSTRLVGYVRVVDLFLRDAPTIQPELLREMMTIDQSETLIGAFIRMRSDRSPLARVVDSQDGAIGVLHSADLSEVIFRDK